MLQIKVKKFFFKLINLRSTFLHYEIHFLGSGADETSPNSADASAITTGDSANNATETPQQNSEDAANTDAGL